MSFSAEMKDFLNAYKTGQSINASRTDQDYKEASTDAMTKKTARDNDPDQLALEDETARAKLSAIKDSMATSAMRRGNIAAQTAYYRSLANGGAGGTGLAPPGTIVPGAVPAGGSAQPNPVPQGQGALPIAAPSLDDGRQMYADGGLVPDDEDSETTPDDETSEGGAIPLNVPQPANAPTDVSSRGRGGIAGVLSPQLLTDATKAGLNYNANAYGLTQRPGAVRMPGQAALARAYVQGHGGLNDQEMAAIKKAIDPDGTKYTESQRNAAALGSVYQYWNNKGDPDKAQRIAGQMLQYYRNASQRYAAIAAHAAQGGNLDLASKALVRSYQNIPDGHDLEVMPNPDGGLMYAVTGPDGDVVTKGVATPQQMYSSAMGLASGGFDKALLHAAGVQEQAAATKGGAGLKPGDRAKESALPDAEIKTLQDKALTANPDKPMPDEDVSALHDTAVHLMQQNRDMQPGEAVRAAQLLLNPGTKRPGETGLQDLPGEDGEPHTIQFGNGMKAQLGDDQLNTILNMRAAKVKAAVDKINSDMEAQDTPSRTDQAIEGAKQVGKGVVGALPTLAAPITAIPGIASKVGDALSSIYGEHIPQSVLDAVEATKGAIGGAASRAAGAVGDALSNKGAIPVDEEARPL